ncbi:MAG: hypothetical protein R2704_11755 [Microthrixaceae bacterium]
MLDRTRQLWDKQHRSVGDRLPLFEAVARAIEATTVLYPGSYVDVSPAFVWPSVTFVDVDRRADRFFRDAAGVAELVAEHRDGPAATIRRIHGDYQQPLDLHEGSFDLIVSLYAGFISEHCTQYLRIGGHLLVNSSHGDAAMASIDPRYRLAGVVIAGGGRYRVTATDLETYLVPKREVEVTRESLHQSGRGVAYTRSPFAYLFERVR